MAFVKSEFDVFGRHLDVDATDEVDVMIDTELNVAYLLGEKPNPETFYLIRVNDWVSSRLPVMDDRCQAFNCPEWHTCHQQPERCQFL